MKSEKRIGLGALILVAALAIFSIANTSYAQDGKWEYVFAPYLMGAGLDGTVGIRGHEAEVEASFGDVLKNLEFGFMGHFEAQNETWIVLGDLVYTGLGAGTAVPSSEIDFNQWIVEGGAGYRVNKNFEALFGGRFYRIDGTIQFHGPLGLKVKGDQNWFDPYIGARAHLPLSEKAQIVLRGDIGGFGVGSDFAWSITPSFVYRASDRISIVAFYRWLDVDREDDDNGFKFDVLTSGPGFGAAMHF